MKKNDDTNEQGHSLMSLLGVLAVVTALTVASLSVLAGNNNCTQDEKNPCVSPFTLKLGRCTVSTKRVDYTLCTSDHDSGLTKCLSQPYECVFTVNITGRWPCPSGSIKVTNAVNHTVADGEDCGGDEDDE